MRERRKEWGGGGGEGERRKERGRRERGVEKRAHAVYNLKTVMCGIHNPGLVTILMESKLVAPHSPLHITPSPHWSQGTCAHLQTRPPRTTATAEW